MDSIEKQKEYKEQKVLEKKKTKDITKKQKSKVSSLQNVSNKVKKIGKGNIIKKVKKKTKTRSQLVKELDTIFSRYIRLTYIGYDGTCKCVTCGIRVHWKNIQNGHFITRSNYKYRRREDNCFPQCMPCNIYKSGNYIAYTLFMIGRYGQDFVKNMQEDKELVKISTVQIREMIDHYTNAVNRILEQIELYKNKQFI